MPKHAPKKPKIVSDNEMEIVIRPSENVRNGQVLQQEKIDIPTKSAILPVRNMVIFPGTVVPLAVGRDKSRRLLNEVLPDQKVITVVCQKDPHIDDPGVDDLHQVGTAAIILKLLQMEEGTQSIIVHGLARVKIQEWLAVEPYFSAKIEVKRDVWCEGRETEALTMNARNLARRVIELSPSIPDEADIVLDNIDQPGSLADFMAANIPLDLSIKQDLLEELNVNERLRKVCAELQRYLEILELSNKIQDKVRANIDKSQREYFLQEQLKAIQGELGQLDEKTVEVEGLRKKIETAGMPESVLIETMRELKRMERIPNVSPEYSVVRSYLDLMTELPWNKSTEDILDVNRAKQVLDEDHYNLEKVKRRILEYLAVRKLAPASRGPILCFVGPPGVGKTSLGQSIAKALGRKFIRMSLGGMRDEAELRGHRRTYIGAMPGRIIQEIRKAGTNNPVFMLDELDKVGADFRGDPSSALLEILDPAQNHTFQDHYLNVPFDLTKVLFIGTANYMVPVPPALRDRMEIIELPGYTEFEKLRIAKGFLIPRQLKENGLTRRHVRWTDDGIKKIIASYTREAGVRDLERQIAAICRSIAASVAGGKVRKRTINPRMVAGVLGPAQYESELALRTSTSGVATGLAYTPAGGEIIFIEATSYPGNGQLTLTGNIGDVMKESAQAALSLLKSQAGTFNLSSDEFSNIDIHVHVPAGAIPKDGPSAGVAMFTAVTSLMTGQAVRSDVAMTGEITLRGLVLPVGGVKEKILAAKRAGIQTIVLPARNRKDLVDIPSDVSKSLHFEFAKNVKDVLKVALDGGPARRKSPNRG